MNLNNLNLVELNVQEAVEVDGGAWYYIAAAIISGAVAAYDAISDMHEGYVEAYNNHNK